MPGVFKAPPLPVLFTVLGMAVLGIQCCDWLSGFVVFCRERRLAFVAV